MNTSSLQLETAQQDKALEAIEKVISVIQKSGDELTLRKLEEVHNKWVAGEVNIGFCGHFSAGKSTMINQLLGKPLLPASPIPTSANLVIIRHGEPHAVIHFMDGTSTQIDVAQIEQWKDYCKNGQEVERVEIFDDHPLLENGVQLLDTPGIDSTDDAHQAATEAALHLADFIIFVTDYNHVQSEVNFNFIKSLKEKGKALLLLINQIDKHREQELTLALFQERVKEGLLEWGIELDGLLFTSMKVPEHPYNQFAELAKVLEKIKAEKNHLITQHVYDSVHVLLQEHRSFLLQQQEESRTQIQAHIERFKQEIGWDEHPTLYDEYQESLKAASVWRNEIEEEMEKILENAIITPYTTTQLAQALIESYQKDFKVGWLFSQKKTEEERIKREDALYQELSEKVLSQIEWHLKELLKKKSTEWNMDNRSFQAQIIDWTLSIPKEWLTQLIKTDTVSREFVYTYTKELAKKIHQLYKNKVEGFIDQGSAILTQQHEDKYRPLAKKIAICQLIAEEERKLQELEQKVDEQMMSYLQLLPNRGATRYQFAWEAERLDLSQINTGQQHAGRVLGASEKTRELRISFNRNGLQEVAQQLQKAADILRPVPALGAFVQELSDKAKRLEENRFTVCLFGAFSAGKSSFANALLGDQVLPVSPNPTTAAINQVLPATANHPAGTARIKMKSRKQVEEEITLSLKRLQLTPGSDPKQNLKQIVKIKPNELRPSLKAYYSFIQACSKGWDEVQELLGTQFTVEQDEFTQYVAVERKACFVESIQLFHDSYLSRNGIEIIDTPGADSIYARHTNVTFNYIKNADAILYVTYYNHAFSKADREFLDQLGRVKEQFALDKMFFLVNAADLASSGDELHGVVQHVEQNLLQSGIRFPRIFPVSSLRAIEGMPGSGMEEFEEAFFSFIQDDITQLLIESAHRDLEKAFMLVKEMKQELVLGADIKQAKIEKLRVQQERWLKMIADEAYPGYINEISKEIQELLYYVKQRIFFNFQQQVNEAFHPSLLSREQGGKKQLEGCLEEFLFNVLFQVKEELKATSLRLETYIYRLLDRAIVDWQRRTEAEGIDIKGDTVPRQGFTLPDIPEQWLINERKGLDGVLGHYKNPKYFFEQGGKEKLKQSLEENMQPIVEQYLKEVQDLFQHYYTGAWSQVEERMKEHLASEMKLAVASRVAALNGEVSAQQLDQVMANFHNQIFEGKGGNE